LYSFYSTIIPHEARKISTEAVLCVTGRDLDYYYQQMKKENEVKKMLANSLA
jgi:hypothetical protein